MKPMQVFLLVMAEVNPANLLLQDVVKCKTLGAIYFNDNQINCLVQEKIAERIQLQAIGIIILRKLSM